MLLQDIGNRIRRSLAPSTTNTPEKREHTASVARQDRAGTVVQLQDDVHRLQHEIADLSQSPENGSNEVDQAATDKRIHELQNELEHAQQALAKYQGRV